MRMEDIDPPREQAGAADAILRTLEAHCLLWDADVLYQSTRSEAYLDTLSQIETAGLSYRCNCSRKRLSGLNGKYDKHCLSHPPPANCPAAIRLNIEKCLEVSQANLSFNDAIQGSQPDRLKNQGDFVIHRKDQLFAYQLAVVTDDIFQGISHVVRGSDLLDTTQQQLLLFATLKQPAPQYAHIPVMVDANQHKLSKQNHAPAINDSTPQKNLLTAMHALNMEVPHNLHNETIDSILGWAIQNWSIQNIPRRKTTMEAN